ncbi:MAG: calcium-binding protein P [Bacteroidaceae bacterium]|nr:calcium-binding protein P [Bacteroidaceae bacterium]
MRKLLSGIIWGIVCCMAVAVSQSCSEEADCTDATRPMMNANFYTVVKDTLPDGYVRDSVVGIAWDSLTVTAFGTDSVIINRETSVHAVSLPLRYAEETTVIVLHYTDAYKDTVTLHHKNTPYFLNMDCGYQMKQELRDISFTMHLLDSIVINDPKIGIYGTENLSLYY